MSEAADDRGRQAAGVPATGAGRVWALVLAGGSGARLGSDRPKGFVALAGRPLLAWSLLALARHPRVSDLLAVVPTGWEEAFGEEVAAHFVDWLREDETRGGSGTAVRRGAAEEGAAKDGAGDAAACAVKLRGAVPGGARRQDSVRLGLEAARTLGAPGEEDASDRVLVHDAARPLVPTALITRLLDALDGDGGDLPKSPPRGVIPVVAVGATLKEVDAAGRILRTVPRAGLLGAQTPQAFPLEALRRAHRAAERAGFSATDDALLFEWQGWPVTAIPGAPQAIKVTYPEELMLAAGWLGGSGQGTGGADAERG